MKKIMITMSGAAFVAALGIVGSVENGADISRMVWACLLVLAAWGFAKLGHSDARTKN